MGKSFMVSSGTNNVAVANTKYFLPGTARNDAQASETNAKRRMYDAGSFSGLGIRVTSNSSDQIASLKSRVNGADGNQIVSITAATTGWFEDSSNSDAVVATDDFAYEISIPAGSGTMSFTILSSIFEASSDTIKLYSNIELLVAPADKFMSITGNGTVNTAQEIDVESEIENAGTFQNFSIIVTSNSSATAPVIRSRVNGANGNCAISVTALTTGFFEDVANSDIVSAGDMYNFIIDGTGFTVLLGFVSCTFVNTASEKTDMFVNLPSGFATTTNIYMALEGMQNSATESMTKSKPVATTGTMSNLKCRVTAATNAGTLYFRKNGANGNQSVSLDGSTGWFEDVSNTDEFIATDELNTRLNSALGTQVQIFTVGMTYTPPGVSSSVKSVAGVLQANIKKVAGVAIADVKIISGVANT